MRKFVIRFDPPIPPADPLDPPANLLESVDVATVMDNYTQEHDLTYSIDDKVIGYYPASILTIMNDVHLEWMLLQEGRSHDVTLSGYTVLQTVFEPDGVQFYNPALEAPDWQPRAVGGKYDPAYLVETFREATAAVWGFIKTIGKNRDSNEFRSS